MVDSILQELNPQNKDLLLVALQKLSVHGRLDEHLLSKVAQHFNVSPAKVYGVASFYSFIPLVSTGRYVIRICKSISCDMANKDEIVTAIKEYLGIDSGQTTSDKMFTLLETNCLGWCDEAPAMIINDVPYTHLTNEKVIAILTKLKEEQ
ncbi:MAG: NAD(P)H-dependent oxidoreductase subunit E [Spirochaetota bacterium]